MRNYDEDGICIVAGNGKMCSVAESIQGMKSLRNIFPDGEANYENFCLFSTSGVHGSYMTIEEVEKSDGEEAVTFLIIQPRIVCLQYGVCEPKTDEDFKFLKKLRRSSKEVVNEIGE